MKKLLVLALVVFGLAACQTEPQFDVQMGGEQEVMLTVSLPDVTRASSADGFDLANIADTDYTLRYILEVYRVLENNTLTSTRQRFVKTSDDLTMVFPVRLAPGYQYQVVAWADIVEGDSEADRYYDTQSGLQAISIIENDTIKWNAMDETRDAYTATQTISTDNLVNGVELKLKRPFAKLRVVATDIDAIRKVGLEPTKATVVYSQKMYRTFNAVTGDVSAADAKTHSDFATNVYTDVTGEYTLFADYFFVPANGGTVKFELTVKDVSGATINSGLGSFNTDISVERNKLTTIKGDVLTKGGDINVTIEGNMVNDIAIFNAFKTGGEVKLDKNYTIGGTLYVVANATLDLNGYTLKNMVNSNPTDVIIVRPNAILTIIDTSAEGEGTIEAVSGNDGYAVISEGTLNIEGGIFKSGVDAAGKPNAVIYARAGVGYTDGNVGGKVYVSGGQFPNEHNSGFVLNKKDSDRNKTVIEVTGGSFQNFNPNDNAAEGAGTNFCAEGYEAVADTERTGWYNVVKGGGVKR